MSKQAVPVTQELDLETVVDRAVGKHGTGREAVIPILNDINEAFGFISGEALGQIRRRLNTPEEGLFLADSHLYAVASFYQMFSLRPLGKHVIRFCESAPCHVTGARQVIEAIQNHLGIQIGETTPDRQWTLLATSCLGICSVGPVITIDEDIYGNLNAEKVPGILAKYR